MRTITKEELASIVGGDMEQVVVSHRKDGGSYAGAVVIKSMGVSNPGRSGSSKGTGSRNVAPKVKVEETKTTEVTCSEPTVNKFEFSLNPVTRGASLTVDGSSGSCVTKTTIVRKTSSNR